MARGDKNYSEVTHKASKEGTKAKQKAVWDMIGAKKKLHEMVEALIGGDSKAAAAALHEYLQAKTRSILGENDEEMSLDLDGEGMDGEEHDELGGEGDEHEECEHCHGEGCEHCEHDELDGEDDGEEHLDLDMEEPVHEGNDTEATSTFKGAHNNAAKDLSRKVKGKIAFKTKGKAKLTKPHNNAAPGLDRKVKGDIKFDTKGSAKLTHPHNNAAPGLDRKVKGTVKF